eukprot:TRINITY_DN49948_c0_g1_i1.p1 TRINITY_DN49948_c0_g1~~TRINITY_DN49948_c0_g1_i1.p1  ORF type:complete len:391 (+),score=76.21 TRINITY_DN49948_c0_g1_i1:44-1216(+)
MGASHAGVPQLLKVSFLFFPSLLIHAQTTHYENPPCQHDEVQGEVLGASGYTCSPRCDENSFNCAMDVPLGTTAQPLCMLKDVDQRAFCALVCQVDAQCPSGAKCAQLTQAGAGICTYAASFTDWARSVTTRKLTVGWPSKKSEASVEARKTFDALSSLKSKYSIDDGDVDMIVLKDLVSQMGAGAGASQVFQQRLDMFPGFGGNPPRQPAMPSSAGSYGAPSMASQAHPSYGGSGPATATKVGGSVRSDTSIWEGDLARLGREASQGFGGLENELNRDLYLAEHLNRQWAASDLFRTVVIFIAIYLIAGSFVKYQMTGASGINMIPHIGFWSEYPSLVADGVTYSKMILGGGASSYSSSPAPDLDLTGGLDGSLRGSSSRGGAGAFEAL